MNLKTVSSITSSLVCEFDISVRLQWADTDVDVGMLRDAGRWREVERLK